MSTPNSPYEVGYCRPPSQTQFKSGQSGNPKGRPPGSRNMHTILREELEQKVQVTENGRPKMMTKRRVAVRQQVDKAVKGDPKAFSVLVKLDVQPIGPAGGAGVEGGPGPSEIPPAGYDDVVSDFLRSIQQQQGGSDDDAASSS
ncbi:MAG: DUF5681 domain-containing protein [Brevundimonas sp.]